MKLKFKCKNCDHEKENITSLRSVPCDRCKAYTVLEVSFQGKKVVHKHKKHHRSTKPLTSRPFEELLKKTND